MRQTLFYTIINVYSIIPFSSWGWGEMFNNEYEESKWDNLTQGDEGKEINGSGKMPQGTPVLRVWREEMGKIDVES